MSKKNTSLIEKIDLLEKSLQQNSELIQSLKLGQQYLINEKKSETISKEAELEAKTLKVKTNKKNDNDPNENELLKHRIHIDKLKQKISDYDIKFKNYDVIKQNLFELKDTMAHFRDQFEEIKKELHDKSSELIEISEKYDKVLEELNTEKSKSKILARNLAISESELKEKTNELEEISMNAFEFKNKIKNQNSDLKSLSIKYRAESEKHIELNKKLNESKLELKNLKKDNDVLMKQLITQGELIRHLREQKVKHSIVEESRSVMKKSILEQNIEINSLKLREKNLKDIIEKKDKQLLDYVEIVTEKENKIKLLAEQQELIRLGIKASDDANKSLLLKIKQLEEHLLQVNQETETIINEKEAKEKNYKMLLDNKEQDTKKRLRDMAESESRKEVLFNMRIQELKSLIGRQRGIIDKRDKMIKALFDSINIEATNLDAELQKIDYSILDEPLDIKDANEREQEILLEEDSESSTKILTKKELKPIVHSALVNREQDEIIINSLIDKGYKENLIKEVINEEKLSLSRDVQT